MIVFYQKLSLIFKKELKQFSIFFKKNYVIIKILKYIFWLKNTFSFKKSQWNEI